MDINLWTYGEKQCPLHRTQQVHPKKVFDQKNTSWGSSGFDYENECRTQLLGDSVKINYKIINKDLVIPEENNIICLPAYGWDNINSIPWDLSERDDLVHFAINNNIRIVVAWLKESIGWGAPLDQAMEKSGFYEKITPEHFVIVYNTYDHKQATVDSEKLRKYCKTICSFKNVMGDFINNGTLEADEEFFIFRNFKHKFALPLGTLTYRPLRVEAFKLLVERNLLQNKDYFYTVTSLKPEVDISTFIADKHKGRMCEKEETKSFLIDYGLHNVFKSKSYDKWGNRLEGDEHPVGRWMDTPIQIKQSCVQVIFETRVWEPSLTEKTWRPLWLGQPFLWHSYQNLKPHLESLGFKFYDWIDYSFDSIEHPYDRLLAIFDEMDRLSKLDLVMLIKKHSHITNRHNRKVFRELMHDYSDLHKFLRNEK